MTTSVSNLPRCGRADVEVLPAISGRAVAGPGQSLTAPSFLEDILVVTLIRDNSGMQPSSHPLETWINGDKVTIPFGQQVSLKRNYVALLVQTEYPFGFVSGKLQLNMKPRFCFQLNYDPAGQAGVDWLHNLASKYDITRAPTPPSNAEYLPAAIKRIA